VLKACERLGVAFIPWYPLGDESCAQSRGVKQLARRLACACTGGARVAALRIRRSCCDSRHRLDRASGGEYRGRGAENPPEDLAALN